MALKVECEVNIDSEPCVIACDNNKLFVGVEDGSIRSFEANQLSSSASWAAHAVQPFSIGAAAGKVYSASNDGGVKVWTADGQKVTEFPRAEGDIGALYVYGKLVFTGDEVGTVTIYEDNMVKAIYSVLEEVKDLQFREPFLFTARDLYITVTEIKPEESKTRFVTRHTMEGRPPLRISGDRLLNMARGGNSLRLHYATVDHEFKMLHEVKVSDMIVTSMDVSGDYTWTGGWDGHIRRWHIDNDQLKPAGDIDLGACINALVADSDCVYAAVTGGKLIKVKAVLSRNGFIYISFSLLPYSATSLLTNRQDCGQRLYIKKGVSKYLFNRH